MKRSIIGVVAIAALLLGAGHNPRDAEAARRPSIEVSQNLKTSPGQLDIKASGSGFAPSSVVGVDWNDCYGGAGGCNTYDSNWVTADRKGAWISRSSIPCGLAPYVKVRAGGDVNPVVDTGDIKTRC